MSERSFPLNRSAFLSLFEATATESSLFNATQSDLTTLKESSYDGDYANIFDQLANATKQSPFTTEIYFSKNDSLIDEELFKKDFVFDRTDVRVIFITMYTLVFCCCFFGESNNASIHCIC